MKALRDAEKVGQQAKKGLFKSHVAKSNGAASSSEATVTRVFSADTIFVRNKAGVEQRLNISSVRQPKPSDPKQSAYTDAAKEYLRKKIIGKHVKVSIDGKRPAADGYDAKEVATVVLNDKNIGLQLVSDGWCSVVRHRRDDLDRSPDYDELLAAEEAAQKEKKGMWSDKPPATKHLLDASESLQKAKMQLGSLQRMKKIPAVVDFVKGGARFVVHVPREGIKMNLVLGGIRAPKSARGTEKGEPFGQEAHDLAIKRLQQRDVEIDVWGTDKVGGFIGELYVNRESFAKVLVEEGFATLHPYSAEQLGNATELNAAEQRAKDARRGIWHNWDPNAGSEDFDPASSNGNGTNGDAAPVSRKPDYRDVIVTDINAETGALKIQLVGENTRSLEAMMKAFKSFHVNPTSGSSLEGPPKAGDYVAARFSEDGEWYRARIRSNDRLLGNAVVEFIDFGNSEKLPWAKLRPLSQPQFQTAKLKGQAVNAVLSLLQLPTQADYLAETIDYVTQMTAGRKLVANVDYTSPEGTLHVTLLDPSAPSINDSLNAEIVSEGLAMVPKKLKAWERSFDDVLKVLKEKESVAKTERRAMWEYGDLTEE